MATAALIDAAPAAVLKLQEKSGDCTKLTMPELSALAFKYFKGTVLRGNKAQHVKTLEDLIKAQPHVLQLAASPVLTMPGAYTLVGEEESASSDEESASSDEESASDGDPSDLDEDELAQIRALRESGGHQ